MKEARGSAEAAYLFDLGHELLERAREAKTQRDNARAGTPEREFSAGRLLAYNEVISVMQQSAEGLGIPLDRLRLQGVDPDRDFT